MYNILMNRTRESYNIPKWSSDLNINFDNITWRNIHNICMSTIDNNQYRWFQYRLNHRILGIRKRLRMMGLCDTDLCGFCELETETFIHLILECEFTHKFGKNWR